MEAIKSSLPTFMKAPIMHYQHTERPVGIFEECSVDYEEGLFVKGGVWDHCSDVWKQIESGELNKFSIYGIRKSYSPECKLSPSLRTSPCITKALDLYSISIVGDNAINDETFLEVVKSFTELYKNNDILIKSVDTNSSLVHETMDGTMPEDEEKEKKPESEEEEVEKCNTTFPPSNEDKPLEKSEGNTSSILERIGKMEQTLQSLVDSDKKVHSEIDKGEDMTETEEKKEEVEKGPEITKAEPEVKTESQEDLIQKAVMAKTDEIVKAFTEKISVLEGKIAEMEKQTIQKGGQVVVIKDIAGESKSAMISNMEALGGI